MGDQFSFGTVHGPVNAGSGTQNIAGGDQYIADRDQVIGAPAEVVAELARLRRSLDELRLTGTQRQAADRELAAAEEAIRRAEPDRAAAGSHLSRFVQGLKDAGALATAGTAVLQSIHALATWIGPVGAGIIALL
jgi:hypothetical protein